MVPVAFLGRTSTEDSQDPTLSLPRQLKNARAALPAGWVIVAHFYDVESGRLDLDKRGHGHGHERFDIPIPRDGGIADLLDEAQRPDRRFAAVICESIERVARRTYFGTKIEYELEQAGVALCAADEPISAPGRRRSAPRPTLTRRVKQAVSEWYVLQMLELSWDGLSEHSRQGWNTGKPPYGYLRGEGARTRSLPARAEGRTKHRLVPDPRRGPVVTQIYQWRALQRLGYDAIASRLNADPDGLPAAGTDPAEPDRRSLDRALRAGDPDQPQVHRIHGLEPPGQQGQEAPRRPNPRRRVGLVAAARARPSRHPRRFRRCPGSRDQPTRITLRWVRRLPPSDQAQLSLAHLRRVRALRPAHVRGEATLRPVLHLPARPSTALRSTLVRRPIPRSSTCAPIKLTTAVHDFFAVRVLGPTAHGLPSGPTQRCRRRSRRPQRRAARPHPARTQALGTRQDRLIAELDSDDSDGPDPDAWRHYRAGVRQRFAQLAASARS